MLIAKILATMGLLCIWAIALINILSKLMNPLKYETGEFTDIKAFMCPSIIAYLWSV